MTETSSTPKRGRRIAGVLAGALALGVLPLAMPASAQVTPRSIESACPPAEIPADVFEDVDTSSTHADAIDCIAAYEITVGDEDGNYSPAGTVPREQMATFIARLIDYVDPTALDPFDVSDDSNFPCDVFPGAGTSLNPHYVAINQLALATYDPDGGGPLTEQAIVEGTGDNADDEACFSPSQPVTRAQMASFIARAQGFLGVGITATDDYFNDDNTDVHEANIDALAEEQIAAGVTATSFNPGGNVQRDQMASFLARKLDYLFDNMVYTDIPDLNATVTLDATTAVEGAEIDGSADTASSTLINTVAVTETAASDDCVVDATFNNDATNPLAFTIELDADAVPEADTDNQITCVLEFTTTFDNTDVDVDEITITVTDTPATS